MRHAEPTLAAQAELAYKRNVADWHATRPATAGASATQGHASQEPSRGQNRVADHSPGRLRFASSVTRAQVPSSDASGGCAVCAVAGWDAYAGWRPGGAR